MTNSSTDREVVILSGARTAFGTLSGALKSMSATDLAVPTAVAAMERAGVKPEQIDHVIYGNVLQTANDAIYLARHVGLRAGVPIPVPAITLNRLCGSGFQVVISAAEQILTGQANVVLCGGSESMSQAPHVIHGLRDGAKFGRPPKAQDLLWESLTDTYTGQPMAITAENIGEQYNLTMDEVNAYALDSHRRWAAAHEAGKFAEEIVPVEIKSRRGTKVVDTDEHPRPTTVEDLNKLRPVFKKDGLVTAGNASGICDGAASLVVADAAWARAQGLKPIAKLVSWGIVGCDPTTMGMGPVPASKQALESANLTIDDMDLVEVNEAFAAQALGVERELGLKREITNVNGGAIALGHPLAASGARITSTLINELRRRGVRYGLGSACIGGGQGITVIVEAL